MGFKEAKRLLQSMGWKVDRVRGSHYIFRLNNDEKNEFVLPQHRGDIPKFLINQIRRMKKEYDEHNTRKPAASDGEPHAEGEGRL